MPPDRCWRLEMAITELTEKKKSWLLFAKGIRQRFGLIIKFGILFG